MILYSYWSKHINPIFNLFTSEKQAINASLKYIESAAKSYNPFAKTEAPSILDEIQDQFDRIVQEAQPPQNPNNGLHDALEWNEPGILLEAQPAYNRRPRNQRLRPPAVQKARPTDTQEYLTLSAQIAACKADPSIQALNKVIEIYDIFMDKIINNPSVLHSLAEVRVHEEE